MIEVHSKFGEGTEFLITFPGAHPPKDDKKRNYDDLAEFDGGRERVRIPGRAGRVRIFGPRLPERGAGAGVFHETDEAGKTGFFHI